MKLSKKGLSIILAAAMLATFVLPVAAGDSLPASYSSVEKGYVTSIKDQGETNCCWAYAAMAACESSMIIHNGYDTSLDLSELLTAYAGYNTNADKMGMFDSLQYNSNFVMEGNRSEYTIFALANQQGVVKESANHGQFSTEKLLFDNANTFNVEVPETMYVYNEAYVTDAYKIDFSNRDLVKEYIIKFGAGTAEIASYVGLYYNEETGAYYCYDNRWPSHVVAVVGWDDNYPKENCTTDGQTPENDGAWLIKNSFGTEYGNDGYNWVSYEDVSIAMYPAVFYKLSESGTYTNTYQYDDLRGASCYWDEENGMFFEGGAYMANVFTAQKDNETLEAVSFYTLDDNLDYTAEIYTGVQGASDPTKGEFKVALSGEDLPQGYHTVKLDKPVALDKGEKFSVVINIKENQNPTTKVMVAVDGAVSRKDMKIMDNGESFFSVDGESWIDVCDVGDGNMRIKAFTNSDEEAVELTDYYTNAEGKTREELLSILEADLEKCRPVLENTELEGEIEYVFMAQMCSYAEQVCERPDIFLAAEIFSLIDTIEYYYGELTKDAEPTNPPATEDEFDKDILGDVNGDGKVNIKDATLIQKSAAKLIELTDGEKLRADVNADSKINIKDATAIQKFVAKMETGLPIGTPVA